MKAVTSSIGYMTQSLQWVSEKEKMWREIHIKRDLRDINYI